MARSKEFDEHVVLEKAMEQFWEKGYEKTSMSDLVAHMGIHRKSLYDTFGDKQALYLSAIDCYVQRSKERLAYVTAHAGTAKQAIQGIFEHMIDSGADNLHGCFLVNAATETAADNADVRTKMEQAFAQTEHLLEDLICQGQQAGEFRTDYTAADMASFVHNTMLGIRVQARTLASRENMRRMAAMCLEMLSG